MEVDLEGVADGAGEGGAEDAMAEAVQVEGVESDDSRDYTTRVGLRNTIARARRISRRHVTMIAWLSVPGRRGCKRSRQDE